MSKEVASQPPEPSRPSLAGRWQIPLLGVGVILFGGGLYRIAAAYEPVTFEDELQRVSYLHEAGALYRARAYLLDLLKDTERPAEERGEFHRQLARTIFKAESPRRDHYRENIDSILANFQAALRLGARLAAQDWILLGDTYQWATDADAAVSAYRQALGLWPDRPDRIRRKILEIRFRQSPMPTQEVVADLDAVLAGEWAPDGELRESSPDNYCWAVERKVEWLLEQGEVAAAREHIDRAKERLAGTEGMLVVPYLDARCLHAEGKRLEAETTLRGLRNEWTTHDDLWAKAGWLLGRIQQEDDRPQTALTFYDEVMRSFQTGGLHDACSLGRAECLAALGRFEASKDAFSVLKDRLLSGANPAGLDRDLVRATITTIGESLLQKGQLQIGIDYLRLAVDLVGSGNGELRSQYMGRIADSLSGLARQRVEEANVAASDGTTVEESPGATAENTLVEAAQAYLALADLETLGGEEKARSLELAADSFDAAGQTERVVEVLSRLVKEHPKHGGRAEALHRLGRANQALRQYPEAVAAYERVIAGYPRLPAALKSVVPMAECLLTMGGDEAVVAADAPVGRGRSPVERGVELLIGIVDDSASDSIFTPQAPEFRQALFLLAEYYSRASADGNLDYCERAIVRLEDAIAHYADDPSLPRLTFLLAETYRQSHALLRKAAAELAGDVAREEAEREAVRRLERALEMYERVVTALSSGDAATLTELERTYLRESHLYRGDCLFDLGRFREAIAVYEETAWRYDNQPAAVAASIQIAHCHLRLGERAEARAAFERLQWLLRKIPAGAFDMQQGMSSKEYWEAMVTRMAVSGVY
ncbi:MAG: tetratricopeptide repeat protein [Planctomycetota bacterium]